MINIILVIVSGPLINSQHDKLNKLHMSTSPKQTKQQSQQSKLSLFPQTISRLVSLEVFLDQRETFLSLAHFFQPILCPQFIFLLLQVSEEEDKWQESPEETRSCTTWRVHTDTLSQTEKPTLTLTKWRNVHTHISIHIFPHNVILSIYQFCDAGKMCHEISCSFPLSAVRQIIGFRPLQALGHLLWWIRSIIKQAFRSY